MHPGGKADKRSGVQENFVLEEKSPDLLISC
jgi:hypothetical protein